MGVSCRRSLKEPLMVKIWRTGGFIINTDINPHIQYYNQSGQGACLFGKTEAVKRMHFEDELWLQDAGYALPDDMVMFYKLYLQGNTIAMNTQVRFLHLDASTSLMNEDKKLKNIYASARNGFIFWHRFIYSYDHFLYEKIISILCFIRRIVFTILFATLKGIVCLNISSLKTYIRGYKDAYFFIQSNQYKQLSKIKRLA